MRLVVLAVALTLCGCAVMNASTMSRSDTANANANAAAAQAAEMMAHMRVAQELAEKKCEPILRKEVSFEEERAIGADLAVTFTAQLGHLYLDGATEKDPSKLITALEGRQPVTLPPGGKNGVSTHVAIVGKNLARYSGRPSLPWTFGVIQSETAQAFSTPGGFVFVTTALLKKMNNEAQLAGVLGHEIGHVVQKDMLKKYVSAKHKQCVASVTAASMLEQGAAGNPALAEAARYAKQFSGDGEFDLDQAEPGFKAFLMNVMLMLVQTGNDTQDEFQTDKLALELVSFAGYDPVQYEQFLTTWTQGRHPDSKDRAAKLEALRTGELKDFAQGAAKPELGKVFAPLSAP
jgi:hypothetical protein